MTQNPYAQFGSPAFGGAGGPGGVGGGGGGMGEGFDRFPTPQRTSVLAIFALVLGLAGCIPLIGVLPGALGIVFGGLAIMFISRSRGRLGGLGLAISGVLIGLATTVLWLLFIVGGMSVLQGFDQALTGPSSKMFQALEAGDYQTARTYFDPSLDQAVTDQQLAEFVAAYRAEVGSFQKMPKSFWEYVSSFTQMGQKMSGYQGQPNEIPIPTTFDSGMSVVIIKIPQGGRVQTQPGGILPKILNVGVWAGQSKEVWVLDPRTFKPIDNSGAVQPGAGGGDPAGTSGGGEGAGSDTSGGGG